ncbi:MAG: DNA-directed RNA polymerase subunit omega [Clostridium sp.]|nr:DNA-directed RNA polymerase subunit omega [Clostridium sp.]
MIEPGINSLLEKVDSRYTMVVAAAKRARQLTEGANKLTDCESDKLVTIAINEIDEGKITYIRTKSGIK